MASDLTTLESIIKPKNDPVLLLDDEKRLTKEPLSIKRAYEQSPAAVQQWLDET
ncbi:hypothetical protein [Desulforhopalus singaporensis]|uniref:hypothetical protein n=1 Tax=Desulforhopalus singaporensis TaxID=91360 RepID=UPI0015A3B701